MPGFWQPSCTNCVTVQPLFVKAGNRPTHCGSRSCQYDLTAKWWKVLQATCRHGSRRNDSSILLAGTNA